MPLVTLVTTLHDSSGWSIVPLREMALLFSELYNQCVVMATKGTSPLVIDTLKSLGWVLATPRSMVGIEHITDSRLRVVVAGLDGDVDYVHLVDMDRVLHWAAHYPDELREVVGRIPDLDFTIIGRTRRAFQTHPSNQVETEAIANRVFSLIYGKEVDITAASRGVSKKAAQILMKYSRGRFFDNDSEWPTILLCKGGLKMGYIETEGLEWETRLKRDLMVIPDGRYIDIKEYYEMNPESWVYRTMLAHRIAKAALETYRDLKSCYPTDS